MVALVDMLSTRVEAIAATITARRFAREQVIAAVHQSQGSAGSLGLNEVMNQLQHLEEMIATDDIGASDEQAQAVALVLTVGRARQVLEESIPALTMLTPLPHLPTRGSYASSS